MTVRWGIAGTGRIALAFAAALRRVEGGVLSAVASRSAGRAEQFAAESGAARGHGSFESLLADRDVDVVYVASPHTEHCAQTVAALEAGKHVLVEKPCAMDRAEAERMVAAARASGCFLMEAMWSRFVPAYTRLRALADSGDLGDLRTVHATFGFVADPDPAGRLLNPALGGGVLLDIGVYPINLAMWLLGAPDLARATVVRGQTGVDVETAFCLGWDTGAVATGQASLRTWLPTTGLVVGSQAWVELPRPHHHPESLVVQHHGPKGRVTEDLPIGGDGLRFEIAHVHACLAQGLTESPVMPLSDSLALMVVLDRLRDDAALAGDQLDRRVAGHPD